MGATHSSLGGSSLYNGKSGPLGKRSYSSKSHAMVNRSVSGPAQEELLPEGLAPLADGCGLPAKEDDDDQEEFSVSFGYRAYYEEARTIFEDPKGLGVEVASCASLAVSSAPPSAAPCLRSLVGASANGALTPSSCSPPSSESRKRNTSFSFLSGAAMGANATLANSFLVSSTHSRALLVDMDSPKAFRHIWCPPRPSRLGVPQWISPEVLGQSRPSEQKPIGITAPQQRQQHQCQLQQLSSGGATDSWTLSGSSCHVGSASSASSAGSSGSSMSNSAPDLQGPSFLLPSDVQVAGGAAGEDRVQAVCSEENGWLFCGVYDGFNGRDAADFLAANLYENIGMHLRLLQWRLQVGSETAVPSDSRMSADAVGGAQPLPDGNRPRGASAPLSGQRSPALSVAARQVGPADAVDLATVSAPQAMPMGPAEGPAGSGLDLSFLQPWVLCSCGSSLCECPGHGWEGPSHVQAARLSSPPSLPTVNEDEGPSWGLQQQQRKQASSPLHSANGPSVLRAGEGSPLHQQHPASSELFQPVVCLGLRKALAQTEKDFFRMVEQEMDERPDLTMVGSCVLALLIHGQHLLTMNLGDSRAVLATWNGMERSGSSSDVSSGGSSFPGNMVGDGSTSSGSSDGSNKTWSSSNRISSYGSIGDPTCMRLGSQILSPDREVSVRGGDQDMLERQETAEEMSLPRPKGEEGDCHLKLRAVQLSETHCVDYEPERERVAREHPTDPNAVIGRRVKGKLRVTRAFGAGYLKSEKMNNALMGIFRVRDLESPPYVSSEPYVTAHRLHPLDQFVVIGSDGLFDFFSNEEVVEYVSRFLEDNPHGDPAKHMLEQLLVRAAERAGKTVDELKSIPRGKRRKYHDDTTVIVITLGHTLRTSSASTLM